MPAKSPKQTDQTFETAIERLEQVVEEMEGEKLPLEKLLELYEEGTALVKICQDKLDTAEKRIEIISRGSSGKPRLAEFDPSAASTPSSAVPKPAPMDTDEVSLF